MYTQLVELIKEAAPSGFPSATELMLKYIYSTDNLLDIIKQIGIIPECFTHDSTEEKLFSKASDAVLSRAFRELGLKSTIITKRADSADVLVESPMHGYTLVADAKAFRLSRTAKNPKDFKVTALSGWRNEADADYAVLCSPFFQYPQERSQIYKQAIDDNVALASWEHIMYLVEHNVKESETISLAPVWNFCDEYSRRIVVSESKRCFISEYSRFIIELFAFAQNDFSDLLNSQIEIIMQRGSVERGYWENKKAEIHAYSREMATEELVKSMKIDEKISQIEAYVRGLRNA